MNPTPIFGSITNPFTGTKYACGIGETAANCQTFGLILLLNNLLKLVIVVAGLFALIQIVLAGISFISSGGDTKAITAAWSKIYMSILGLVIVASSFVLAAIFGYLILGDPTAILIPKLYGPQ